MSSLQLCHSPERKYRREEEVRLLVEGYNFSSPEMMSLVQMHYDTSEKEEPNCACGPIVRLQECEEGDQIRSVKSSGGMPTTTIGGWGTELPCSSLGEHLSVPGWN